MRLNFRCAAMLVLMAALSVTASYAQTLKVAIISGQKAVSDTQEFKKAQAAIEAKFGPRQQEVQQLSGQLEQIQQQLRAPNVTQEQEQQLTYQGQQKQKQLQRLNEDLQADFNRERADVLGRVGPRMQEVIKKLAEAKGLDVVIDLSNTLYVKPALDITAEATAAYDKEYPAK